MDKRIKIIIACHKYVDVPKDDLYLPVFVGSKGKEDIGFERDDSGNNISEKNAFYSELTGLYWAWKNLDSDFVGLCHYRRYFKKRKSKTGKDKDFFDKILTKEEAEVLLSEYSVIVPNKRKYYIESLYSHYSHTLDGSHLDIAKEIIEKDYPQYLASVVEVYSRTWGYMWNMCILPNDLLNEYCEFLFPILFKMEEQIDTVNMSAFDKRLFGRVSEILFNAWLVYKSKDIQIKEVPVISPQSVNWIKKGSAFLMAKFFNKRYEESF